MAVGDYDHDVYSGSFSTSEAAVVGVEVGLASNIDDLQILLCNVAWARFCCNHRTVVVVNLLLHV